MVHVIYVISKLKWHFMTMQAAARPLRDLYTTLNKAYVIPAYQRPFAWSGEKAKELLNSILEDSEDESVDITSIGTLLFHPLPLQSFSHYGNNLPTSNAVNMIWEVIDGQQRLTTLALIGFVLNQKLKDLLTNGLTPQIGTDLQQLYCTQKRLNDRSLPLIIRDGDNFDTGYQSEIAILLDYFNNYNPSTFPRIGKSLLETYDAIKTWVNDNLSSENFEHFTNYMLDQCNYIEVSASEQSQAFTLFETLNSTSEPLTALEVFKANVIRELGQKNNRFSEINRYVDYTNLKRDDVIKKSNSIAFIHAQAWSGVKPKIDFNRLKRYLDRQINEESIAGLEKISKFMQSVWENQDPTHEWLDQGTIDLIRFLKASKHDAPLPLLCRYYIHKPALLPKVIKIVVAFFVLWRTGLPTNSLPQSYRDLLDENSTNNISVLSGSIKNISELASYFKNILIERWGHPHRGSQRERDLSLKNTWINNFQNYLSYDSLPTICRLLILLNIEATIKNNLLPNDPWSKNDDIEHISARATAQQDLRMINSLGNLTFLPATINRSIQEMAWEDKRQIYQLLSQVEKNQQTTFSDGRNLGPAIQEFINSPTTPALVYLRVLSANENWGATEMHERNILILSRAWEIFYSEWLNQN